MSSALDLDLARLSLAGSPYNQDSSHHQQQQQQTHVRTASSLERSGAAPDGAVGGAHSSPDPGLQPHQVMQPPLHQGPPPQVRLKEPQRRRGIVKFFNSLKGFGFVVDNDPTALGGQEVFCHFSAISGKGGFRSLAEGEEVEYELVQGPKGFQAANLTGPGGRSVVGDPKARMQKPPAYLPLAPFAMPLGNPYLTDPYHPAHAQHPHHPHHLGMYPGSPYTQHVLYVPAAAAASMQPSHPYAYAPVPLGGPGMIPGAGIRQASQAYGGGGAGGGVGAGAAGGVATTAGSQLGSPSPFAAPQYQSYAAPSSLASAAAAAAAGGLGGLNGSATGGGADRYSAASPLDRIAQQQQQQPGGGVPTAFAAGSPQQSGDYHQRSASATGAQAKSAAAGAGIAYPGAGIGFGTLGGGVGGGSLSNSTSPNPAAFSPPGGNFIGLPGLGGAGAGAGNAGGMPAFGGFAPFSPPTFNHAPLYPPPTQQQQQQQYAPQTHPISQHHPNGPSPAPNAATGAPAASALFGSSGTPVPAPIGSRSGTPAAGAGAGGRSTPALGNGSLGGNDAWKAPSSNGGDAGAHH
ncbi:hypothetical protein JCM10908_003961 [Rhodotorula pacifica]|uniref:cold-shock protein n=1 Tax=Rhodotorula pacifica TaxID=1495444 RepID=UPI00317F6563